MDIRASVTCGLGLITLHVATYGALSLFRANSAGCHAGCLVASSTCKLYLPTLYWFDLFVSVFFFFASRAI